MKDKLFSVVKACKPQYDAMNVCLKNQYASIFPPEIYHGSHRVVALLLKPFRQREKSMQHGEQNKSISERVLLPHKPPRTRDRDSAVYSWTEFQYIPTIIWKT